MLYTYSATGQLGIPQSSTFPKTTQDQTTLCIKTQEKHSTH